MISRTFIPGTEWLFYKIYCGVPSTDKILLSAIQPLLIEARKNSLIDKAFFIRYADPDHHIRLRFRVKNDTGIGELMKLVNRHIEPWFKEGFIWKVMLDTYERELERYEPRLIECAESLFSIDSLLVQDAIKKAEATKDDSLRWRHAIAISNMYLDYLNVSLTHKERILSILQEGFRNEQGLGKEEKVQMDMKYREYQNDLKEYCVPDQTKIPIHPQLNEAIKQQCASILEICKKENIGQRFLYLQFLPALLHMHCNRMFKSKQRRNEMVVYYFLWKVYKTQVALKVTNI